MFKFRISGLAIALTLLVGPALPSFVYSADEVEEVVAVGTRREARSVGDSPAPVDIISGSDFTNQGAADLPDMIRTLVPSFNVNTQPISDAATLIRPANLRGLPPDNMLVLVNGKRRHRGAVISFLGSGISDGAQGPDISAIPSIALKQVEVLRDGASAQYGSDAIAGIMNFVFKDNAEGTQIEIRSGEYSDGDGDMYRIAANVGMPFTANGLRLVIHGLFSVFVILSLMVLDQLRNLGSKKAQEFVQWASEKQRVECPLSDLWISVKCGESDTTSGLASNPAVGNLMDKLEPLGVHLCFGETSELTGAEKVCATRGATPEASKKFMKTWSDYNDFILKEATNDLSESQPTAGNIAGGLTTIEEKAFGNFQKIGTRKFIEIGRAHV